MRENSKLSILKLCSLFIFALGIHLAGTWILPLMDRDETWYAEVSREMNERGDHLVPHLYNQFWLEKPPLLYWCQSTSYRIFGDNEFGARFPAAMASALTTLVIFGFCLRLHGSQRIAWRAAIAFTLCASMVVLGKAGLTDVPATLFTTIAAWAGWELLASNESRRSNTGWWWAFYLSLAMAALAKGPVAILPIGGLLVFWKWAGVPGFYRIMKWGRGLAIAVTLSALWYVPVQVLTKGKLFSVFIVQQALERSVTSDHGHGSTSVLAYLAMLPFYFLLVFPAFFPWSIWLPNLLRRFKRQRSRADLYLMSGILFTFVLFTLMRTKLPFYTLPAYPLLACMVAPLLPEASFVWWSAGMLAFNLIASFIFFPLVAPYSVSKQLAKAEVLPRETAFATVGGQEPSLVWYFRRQIRAFNLQIREDEVADYMRKPGPRLCILPAETAAQILLDPGWKIVTAHGFNISKGRSIELSMIYANLP